jgi:hypothetical protein
MMQMVDAMGGNYKRHLEYLFYALDPADPNQARVGGGRRMRGIIIGTNNSTICSEALDICSIQTRNMII